MAQQKLYMLLLGCKPFGRNTEQHDVFFGIAENLRELIPAIVESWPEAKGKIHVDAWREVKQVNGFDINVGAHGNESSSPAPKLFFINLGGYKKDEFEEFHYKMLVAANDKGTAISMSKDTAFYRHTGFSSAPSHVDDKYGIDVDDCFEIQDILSSKYKSEYRIILTPALHESEDEIHLGYFTLDKL